MSESLHILILEDNPTDADLIQFELQEAGITFTSQVVMTKYAYLQAIHDHCPDLILSVYDLPTYNGALALIEARQMCPHTPFILVTGAVSEDRVIEILTLGAKDYVLKQCLDQRLVPSVRRALAEAEEHRGRKRAEAELREAHVALERLVEERTAALRKTEGLYHSLFDNMLDGFAYCRMIFDHGRPKDFIYLDVNKSFESLTGLKNVVGKRVSEVIPGIQESDAELLEAYGRVALTGKPEKFEWYVKVLQMWFSISVYSPEKEHFVAVFEVISARKQAEEAIRQSETQARQQLEEIQSIYDTAPIGLCVLDRSLRYVRINKHLAEIHGVPASDHIGKALREIAPDLAPSAEELAERIFRTGEPVMNVEFSGTILAYPGILRKLLEHWLPLKNADGSIFGINVVIEDITERKKAEEALKDRTQQLEDANKDLESFGFSIAHDLRGPLKLIAGYSQMILKKDGERFDEEARRRFQMITDNAETMGHLIDDLLAFSRLGSQEVTKRNLDMKELIEEVWQELRTIHPNREMTLKIDQLPESWGDRALIRQVYGNLLGNAVKFTQGRDAAVIETGSCIQDSETVYYVRDNGIGFDMRFYGKLFGVFQRLHSDEEYKGTGIGLALVKRIINRHDGRVWAEGEVDKGATFYFTLPNSQG